MRSVEDEPTAGELVEASAIVFAVWRPDAALQHVARRSGEALEAGTRMVVASSRRWAGSWAEKPALSLMASM